MGAIIEKCFHHSRTVLMLLVFFICAGWYAYVTIPKESFPDVVIPFIVVETSQTGISAGDAETLLIKPLEVYLQNIEGVKDMTSYAYEGRGVIILEFQAGLDPKEAIQNVRVEVDKAKVDLPTDADDPKVSEINLSHFPVLTILLSGNVPDRTLFQTAENLKNKIERISSVLKAPVTGRRDEVVEMIINPQAVESYGLSLVDVAGFFSNNNVMVKGGTFEGAHDGYNLKLPGLIKAPQDVLDMPIKTKGGQVVKLKDIATVKPTFEPATNVLRNGGAPTIAIEVSKRTGQNIIETIESVQKVVNQEAAAWHGQIKVDFMHDESQHIRDMLAELENSVITAVLLVMAVMIIALGTRSSLLVGISIPGAFLMGVLALYMLGYTFNIVVLFSLIMSVGMLVDGAIIVVEYADRKMLEGLSKYEAYREAANRMAIPVISSISTILVVFFPLLYWPGIMGKFMCFMPITLIATLTASILMALIFIPVLGALFGKVDEHNKKIVASIIASEEGPLDKITGWTGAYVRTLGRVLERPYMVLGSAVVLLGAVIGLYGMFGKGVQFFPDIEPKNAAFMIKARGNLSLEDKDRLVSSIEQQLLGNPYFKNIYTNVGPLDQQSEDTIGSVTVEFVDWQQRPNADKVLDDAMEGLVLSPDVTIEVKRDKPGPGSDYPINIVVKGRTMESLTQGVEMVKAKVASIKGLREVNDTRPLPGITWNLETDRVEAARYGVNIAAIGQAIQLVTSGLDVSQFRPDTSDQEVDIIVRYPKDYRTLDTLNTLRVNTKKQDGTDASVPIRNFVKLQPANRLSVIMRLNGERYYAVQANVETGVLPDPILEELKVWARAQSFPEGVTIEFKGEEEDKQETSAFLKSAFVIAIFAILVILVTQFNSFFSAIIVLSSVILSTFGVFVGLLVMQQPFSIVMTGLGVIALSGIIVSNNIILLDTFEHLRSGIRDRKTLLEAIIRTGAQRLRPVILTKLTCILGLLPILFRLNIDYFKLEVTVGGPSVEWWIQLSTAIVFGVLFASVLTLVITPALLWIWERRRYP